MIDRIDSQSPRKLAIIAGKGHLPRQLAAACQAQNLSYIIIAIQEQTESDWLCLHPHDWTSLGAVGKTLSLLRQHQATDVVLAGAIQRPSWLALKLDMTGAAWLARAGLSVRGDDGLLHMITERLAEEGFRVRSAQEICGDTILAVAGTWGRHAPDEAALKDIDLGQSVIQGIYGQLDIGQAVVVQEGLILGVEAIEGTDALIQRCGALKRPGPGPILIKLTKPNQDTRVDLPTVGIATVQNLIANGYRGLAVETERTLVIDLPEMVQSANDAQVFLHGIKK
jgi:DUF1009 family protein